MKSGRKASSGFTIIEVLIVLAIAGLILLIVFLAVPALQRNSRNTAIKNDVQNVVGGVAEYQGANNGTMPTTISGTGTITYDGPGTDTTISIQGTTTVATQGTGNPTGSAVPQTGDGPANGTINIYIGRKCNNTTSTRAVAAVYSIETASSTVVRQCVDS